MLRCAARQETATGTGSAAAAAVLDLVLGECAPELAEAKRFGDLEDERCRDGAITHGRRRKDDNASPHVSAVALIALVRK